MTGYNTGLMPNSSSTYESFERLLAGFYLSLLPLKEGRTEKDAEDYSKIVDILTGLAQRHGVQLPEEAIANPRVFGGEVYGTLSTNNILLGALCKFRHDYNLDMDPAEEDGKAVSELRNIIWGIFSRYNIAEMSYEKCRQFSDRRVPKLEKWNKKTVVMHLSDKTIGQVLSGS